MASQETMSNFRNFALESVFPDIQGLKEKGYVGFGAIALIINEKDEILLIQENALREGQDKRGKWSLIYETGKVGEIPELTMLAGIGSELGYDILGKLKQVDKRTFGFDFRRFDGDTPSRSLISIYHLPTNHLPDKSQWGAEVGDLKWVTASEIVNQGSDILRVNVALIIQELSLRNLLETSGNGMLDLTIPPNLTREYLVTREEIPDLFWN